VADTPGIYALLAVTEEERVARHAILTARDAVLIHVVDASHLDRALPLTLQLLTLGTPLVLACNHFDEARDRGVAPDLGVLAERLGIPVFGTVATTGEGVEALAAAAATATAPADGWGTPQPFAAVVATLAPAEGAARLEAEMALCGDPDLADRLAARTPQRWREAVALRDAQWSSAEGFAVGLATARRRMTLALLDGVVPDAPEVRRRHQALDRLFLSPWTGIPIVLLVLYLGFYKFVGQFGAQTVVDWIERIAFDRWLTPVVAAGVRAVVPWVPLQDLLVGPYGLFSLGVRYAVAIVLPIVGAFFLVFALLEDSGYLPRLALLLDRGLKRIGLSGRAVIPLVLGFGCNTMATLVTRTLETKRERIIVTLLLALAIPCSAQLGVVLGILSVYPAAVAVWAGVLLGVFVFVGWLAARLLPGEPPTFYLELPPLRRPLVRNVILKTGTRVRWYFAEIFPLFLLASVILWAGELTGALRWATHLLVPVVNAIGLPDSAASAFLYGFFRRDFGAAGLYDLARAGALGPAALTTAAVTITLFVPCVAQFLVMRRERGTAMATTVLAVATGVAFLVGGGVGWLLRVVGGWA
jgi:ferrous iron transport protein B